MGVAFLGSYLCISILEFKFVSCLNVVLSFYIYVFLYQNLNNGTISGRRVNKDIYVFLYQNLNDYS